MPETIAYLDDGFDRDVRELERTHKEIENLINVLQRSIINDQWPYELLNGQAAQAPPSDRYSQSTNAMILFSLVAAARRLSPKCRLALTDSEARVWIEDTAWLTPAWARLLDETNKKRHDTAFDDGASHFSWSGTFGYDDPFTLTWLFELARSELFDTHDEFLPKLGERAKARIEDAFQHPWQEQPLLAWTPDQRCKNSDLQRRPANSGLDHAFPVLRFIHLYLGLRDSSRVNLSGISTSAVQRYMEQRLHEQLSKSDIQDAGFDASELIYALEGLLLLDAELIGPALLERTSAVIRASQYQNPYWRAVKPFISTPQGLVLFPISVETANAVLRCSALLEQRPETESFFSENLELFSRYVEWLRSRRVHGVASEGESEQSQYAFQGWHSEHVHLHGGIHVWETSQALLFLMDYAFMLDRHIARRALDAAKLKRRPIPHQTLAHIDYWDEEKRAIGEPLVGIPDDSSELRIYSKTGRHVVAPRSPLDGTSRTGTRAGEKYYSILLYGPPGTGKSSFAEEICKALRWDLITVTPSDFISGGESQIEARAKMIFDVLQAQSNVVILFDEIDRMILDRDSSEYGRQSDIFQFMTPGMLTKIADLRKRKRVIFLIATNYAERIDAAAKRPGRLDMQALLPPPDFEGRRRIFSNLIEKHVKELLYTHLDHFREAERIELRKTQREDSRLFSDEVLAARLDSTLDSTRLKGFGELKQIFDSARDEGRVSELFRKAKANAPYARMTADQNDEMDAAVGEYVHRWLISQLEESTLVQLAAGRLENLESDLTLRVGDYLAMMLEEIDEHAGKASKPAITLTSYAGRLGLRKGADDPGWAQKPYDEFLVLLHIATEEEGQIEAADRDLVREAIQSLCGSQGLLPKVVREQVLEALHQDEDATDRLCGALSRLGVVP